VFQKWVVNPRVRIPDLPTCMYRGDSIQTMPTSEPELPPLDPTTPQATLQADGASAELLDTHDTMERNPPTSPTARPATPTFDDYAHSPAHDDVRLRNAAASCLTSASRRNADKRLISRTVSASKKKRNQAVLGLTARDLVSFKLSSRTHWRRYHKINK
jgi:hypothetical protein